MTKARSRKTTKQITKKQRPPLSPARRAAIGSIIGVIIFALSCGIVALMVHLANRPPSGRVLAENSFSNGAWGFTYHGRAITDQGEVYAFEIPEDKGSEYRDADRADDLTTLSNFILNNTTSKVGQVNAADLSRIKELATQVNSDDLQAADGIIPQTADAGSSYITVWNYEQDKTIKIKSSGDYNAVNSTAAAQELIGLINKYTRQQN